MLTDAVGQRLRLEIENKVGGGGAQESGGVLPLLDREHVSVLHPPARGRRLVPARRHSHSQTVSYNSK